LIILGRGTKVVVGGVGAGSSRLSYPSVLASPSSSLMFIAEKRDGEAPVLGYGFRRCFGIPWGDLSAGGRRWRIEPAAYCER
jgi:hypothetical protein